MEEFDIMYSADKTVKLTNKRILVDNGERLQEIMLEDYIGHSFIKQNIGNFGTRAIIFGLLTIFLALGIWNDKPSSLKHSDRLFILGLFMNSGYTVPFFICALLFLFSLFYYLLGKRQYLEIKGKYSSVTIMVRSRKTKSLKSFIDTIEDQHDKLDVN